MKLNPELLMRMKREVGEQINKKGKEVNISFYFFYDNSNTQNKEVFEVARWWIETHNLSHFVKAEKILTIIEQDLLL